MIYCTIFSSAIVGQLDFSLRYVTDLRKALASQKSLAVAR